MGLYIACIHLQKCFMKLRFLFAHLMPLLPFITLSNTFIILLKLCLVSGLFVICFYYLWFTCLWSPAIEVLLIDEFSMYPAILSILNVFTNSIMAKDIDVYSKKTPWYILASQLSIVLSHVNNHDLHIYTYNYSIYIIEVLDG